MIANIESMTKSVNQSAVGKRGEEVKSGPNRREAIFEAALRLFRERGYHGTAINDIGAAAGVSGPALYRHFSGKGEVLAEAIREGSRRIAKATRGALSDPDSSPHAALEALVGAYVQVALENADIYAAYVLESRHLADEYRKPLRRSDLRHREEWKRLLIEVRPDLDQEQARTMVNMAIFSVTSLCIVPSKLDRPALVRLATQRVMALLLAPT